VLQLSSFAGRYKVTNEIVDQKFKLHGYY